MDYENMIAVINAAKKGRLIEARSKDRDESKVIVKLVTSEDFEDDCYQFDFKHFEYHAIDDLYDYRKLSESHFDELVKRFKSNEESKRGFSLKIQQYEPSECDNSWFISELWVVSNTDKVYLFDLTEEYDEALLNSEINYIKHEISSMIIMGENYFNKLNSREEN